MSRINFIGIWGMLVLCLQVACEPTGDEPDEVTMSVVSRGSRLVTVTNAEGWQVTLDAFDVCVTNLEFTQEGETHASLFKQISDFIIPEAMAHPGHMAGGDVTGTLNGQWVISFLGQQQILGEATLLEGVYNGLNFSYCVASAAQGVAATDPVFGHHGYFAGTASKDNTSIHFDAQIDIADTPTLWGGVFDANISPNATATLALRPLTIDPFEADTFFDGIDFGVLDEDGDGDVTLTAGMPAHNILMKTLLSHDHWSVVAINTQESNL